MPPAPSFSSSAYCPSCRAARVAFCRAFCCRAMKSIAPKMPTAERAGSGLIGQKAELLQLVVESALAEKQSRLVEGVRLSRLPEADHLENARELIFRPNPQAESGDRLPLLVLERTNREHRRQIRP